MFDSISILSSFKNLPAQALVSVPRGYPYIPCFITHATMPTNGNARRPQGSQPHSTMTTRRLPRPFFATKDAHKGPRHSSTPPASLQTGAFRATTTYLLECFKCEMNLQLRTYITLQRNDRQRERNHHDLLAYVLL